MKRSLTAAAIATAIVSLGLGAAAPAYRTAVFAGGCFWSVEHEVEHLPGVKDVVVGYSGGERKNPTYRNHDGHLESVKVTYDPSKTSYARLAEGFMRHIDPTDAGGQICDRGPSYRTAIFVSSQEERKAAEAVKAKIAGVLKKPVATKILPASTFWPAEAYHQDYARKNPGNYNAYRIGCGRDRALKAVWAGR